MYNALCKKIITILFALFVLIQFSNCYADIPGSVDGICVNHITPDISCKPDIMQSLQNWYVKYIVIYMFAFNDQQIANTLINTEQTKNIPIEVIVDKNYYSEDESEQKIIAQLKNAGIFVCFGPDTGGLFHHKLIILGIQNGDQLMLKIITGSYNLTNNAAANNDENMVFITSRLLGAYLLHKVGSNPDAYNASQTNLAVNSFNSRAGGNWCTPSQIAQIKQTAADVPGFVPYMMYAICTGPHPNLHFNSLKK